MTTIGYIPARLGSERIRQKNLRPLAGEPLLTRALRTVQLATALDQSYLNTESDELAALAKPLGMPVHRRPETLASNTTKTDEIVIEFLQHHPCDIVVLINPTAPLLKPETIDSVVRRLQDSGAQAVFTTDPIKRHALFKGQPINFSTQAQSPRTQDLEPVDVINFIVCAFDAQHALKTYHDKGHFLYTGTVLTHPMSAAESLDIDEEHEFAYADFLLRRASGPQQA